MIKYSCVRQIFGFECGWICSYRIVFDIHHQAPPTTAIVPITIAKIKKKGVPVLFFGGSVWFPPTPEDDGVCMRVYGACPVS